MGALAVRKNKIKEIIKAAYEAFMVMFNSEYDEEITLQKAVADTIKKNPEMAGELGKVTEIAKVEDEVLNEMANKVGIIEDKEKDEDGYYKLENKLKDIKAEVSEKDIKIEPKDRTKGGRQKTRVDED